MECSIAIAAEDQGTAHIAETLRPHLEKLSQRLSRDFGGLMQHLWIAIELCPAHADWRAPWPFRFQKRVSRARTAKVLGLPMFSSAQDFINVGHLGVRPDYAELARVGLREVPAFVIKLIHGQTPVLERKSARLGGFDAKTFRRDVLEYIGEIQHSQNQTV